MPPHKTVQQYYRQLLLITDSSAVRLRATSVSFGQTQHWGCLLLDD